MIRLSGTNGTAIVDLTFPVEPVEGDLARFIESYCEHELANVFGPPASIVAQRGTGIPQANFRPLPPPRINQLVIPTGASRWGYCLLLATEQQKDLIANVQTGRVFNGLTLTWSAPLSADGLTETQSEAIRTLSLRGICLAPHAITPRGSGAGLSRTIEGVAAVTPVPNKEYPVAQDLYLIPFVDMRYFLQFINVGTLSGTDLTQSPPGGQSIPGPAFWLLQSMLESIAGLNAASDRPLLSIDDLSPRYTKPPKFSKSNDFENAAIMIDAFCWQHGLSVVHNQVVSVGNQYNLRAKSDFVIVSVDESQLIYNGFQSGINANGAIEGFAGLGKTVRANSGGFSGWYGGYQFVGRPFLVSGGEISKKLEPNELIMEGAIACPPTAQVLVNDDSIAGTTDSEDGTYETKDPPVSFSQLRRNVAGVLQTVNVNRVSPLSGSAVIRFEWESDDPIPSEMREQISSDYFNRFLHQFDMTFAGVQRWQQSAYDDFAVYSMEKIGEEYICTTRVTSWPANTLFEVHTPSNGSGGTSAGSSDCPCNCIDTPNLWVNGIGATTKWIVPVNKEKIWKGQHGYITLPAGTYTITWNGINKWFVDIGDLLTAKRWDGSDATSVTTMDGEIRMTWAAGQNPLLEICVTGSVPAP